MRKLITILLLLPLFATATDYYVLTTGSNSNSGTVNNSGGTGTVRSTVSKSSVTANFGATAFTYTPPVGHTGLYTNF